MGERGAGAVAALGAGENTAGGEDQDVTVGELLLELTGETVVVMSVEFFPRTRWSKKEGRTVAALGGNLEGMGRGQR